MHYLITEDPVTFDVWAQLTTEANREEVIGTLMARDPGYSRLDVLKELVAKRGRPILFATRIGWTYAEQLRASPGTNFEKVRIYQAGYGPDDQALRECLVHQLLYAGSSCHVCARRALDGIQDPPLDVPLTKDEAIERVRAYLALLPVPHELVILDHATRDEDFGWVFFYNTKLFLQTRDPAWSFGGNAPVIVNRWTGELSVTGTAHAIEHYIALYRKTHRLRS